MLSKVNVFKSQRFQIKMFSKVSTFKSQSSQKLALSKVCRRRRNKRYGSTSLLTVTFKLIYKDCTGMLGYTQLVCLSTRGVGRSPQT
jgi:hypothetical protein